MRMRNIRECIGYLPAQYQAFAHKSRIGNDKKMILGKLIFTKIRKISPAL